MSGQQGNASLLDSDRPLSSNETDRLGSRIIAEKLAVAVVAAAKNNGMVIGVEGAWGSGKTSLTTALRVEIEKKHSDKVHILEFSPWLISSPAEYAPTFMSDLAQHLDAEADTSDAQPSIFSFLKVGRARRKTFKLANKMRRYGALTSHGIGMALEMAGWFIPGATKVGELAKNAGKALDKVSVREAPNDLKQDISKELAKLKRQFIVIIDDLDRLEPKEAAEVVRLVRSVADFPNIVYVLCYDRAVLARAIEQAVLVDDGVSYLQKILQVTFDVPRPESFDLRNWLLDELLQFYQTQVGDALSPPDMTDLQRVVSTAGSLMKTPRDVKMVLNSIRFHFPPVQDDIYFPDLCWLHIQKILRPDMYRWVSWYLLEWAVISVGDAHATADDLAKAQELKGLVEPDLFDSASSIYDLSNRVPGIRHTREGKERFEIFQKVSPSDLLLLEKDKRLGSPTHFKLYFSFSAPQTALTDTEFMAIWQLATGQPQRLREALQNLAARKRLIGGNWFEYFVDRSARQDFSRYSETQISNMMFEIADLIDEVATEANSKSDFDTPIVLGAAESLVYRALKSLAQRDQDIFKQTVDHIVNDARSIGWLLGNFICDEMRRRGMLGSQSRLSDDPLIELEELNDYRNTMVKRLSEAPIREALASYPSVVSVLFRWRDVEGNTDAPSQWFAQFTQSDEMFLSILNRMRGWRSTMKGVSQPLLEKYVAPFTDWEKVKERLRHLAQGSEQENRKQAQDLLNVIVDLADDPFT